MALWLYGLFLAVPLAALILTDPEGGESLAVITTTQVLEVVIVLVFALANWELIRPFVRARLRLEDWLLPPIGACLTVAIAHLNVEFAAKVFDVPRLEFGELVGATDVPLVLLLVTGALVPAVSEEFAFRGMFQPMLAFHLPQTVAVVVTAAAFATCHLNPYTFPMLMVLGLVLGWLRVHTGSILPPILLHLCHNGFIVILDAVQRAG